MVRPIETIHLFPVLDARLIALLQSLTPDEWDLPTVAKLWTVKDVAAHLLDGNLRTLSIARDGFMGDPPVGVTGQDSLIGYLNRLNADWVAAFRRISPGVLTAMLENSGKDYHAYLQTLDPFGKAIFSVGWAGEDVSDNWFHIAREYTEKWHHQQQIREAVKKPGIQTQELYYPLLDTFMRALPYTYRHTDAPAGTILQFTITGEGGGDWYLLKEDDWKQVSIIDSTPAAHTVIDGSIAWKLFSKSWRRKEAAAYVQVAGDELLGGVVLDMIAVMA